MWHKKGQALLTRENDISTKAVSYVSSLLSWDPMLLVVDQNEIVSCLPQLIQPHHNKMLRVIPKVEEVKQDFFSLLAHKVPRPNGFPTFFFRFTRRWLWIMW